MTFFEALILGLVQGLTEFLPVSSSGHLAIGKELLGIQAENLSFEIAVHAATVLSTIVAFRKDIFSLITSSVKFKYNKESSYILKIALSMVPVLIVGLFMKERVEAIFGSGLLIVGICLLLTALLLALSQYVKAKENEIKYSNAFLIGVAQAFAVLPGLSRSGATISTGLLLGVKREEIAKFSFLMVLVPILGESFLELISGGFSSAESGINLYSLFAGFTAAFFSGLFACKTMISLVKRARLTGFAVYCAVIGLLSIAYSVFY
ncbi:MAG: UDP-diphosphatase [Bacteroidetes bacterium GWE2_39_28]|nr:MAG: UDP-diphosphatase [Bacteroidetes bacterium GWE2_39_28]OFY12503.1 MAG: UDP-diphosphatase [Bacteroidetes bacterium GWF2_39_10]OFZ07242.1 MAG: UDP-diphosphatase [Bacteroidetes bacterium RIFOXYB2_FULL_39_7]OFZ10638.1 MAG: UDP-diphosphatase [Bacteroidetes bacterium RIFOXYC2_FULL_39_11]HCT93454.1 UDP-diphosphatase [Rikenellaceae bacterium]